MLDARAVALAFGFREPDGDHLRAVVPLVDGGRNIEALVALQPDQPAPERRRQHLGDFGLADAGLALDEQRPPHAQREIKHRRQRAVGDVVGLGQQIERGIDGGRQRRHGHVLARGLYPIAAAAYMWGAKARPASQELLAMTKPVQIEKEALRMPTIDPGVRIGHVHLKVADLAARARFLLRRAGF